MAQFDTERYERATLYIAKVLQVMHGRWPSDDLALLLSAADNELDGLYLDSLGREAFADTDDPEWRKRLAAICRTPDEQLQAGFRTPHETEEYKT